LRRGYWVVQDELDLHGLTREQAKVLLTDFMARCGRRGLRCVRIIHGKGLGSKNREPVLKQKVAGWLAQRRDVIAFSQARAAEGGAGAVVVLLKEGVRNQD
jgi:DNA-nicking Smr family endonuclease